MLLSKKSARVLAIASTFAFTLTGMSAAQPAKVQAAAVQAPTVKVLGATLRLDGETGRQSLRFGIEVSNASNAEACGIDITYGDKTITVGTDVDEDTTNGKKKHTAIYSKDTGADKIVYSAVITGIPKANYDKDFSVKGYVKEKVSDDNKAESVVAERSVKKVVEALQVIDPTIKINDDGNLVKVVDGVDTPITKEDIGTTVPEPYVPRDLVLSEDTQVKSSNGTAVYEDGKAKLTLLRDNGGQFVKWYLNGNEGIDLSKYYVVVDYTADQEHYPLAISFDNLTGKDFGVEFPWQIPQSGKLNIGESTTGIAKTINIKFNNWKNDQEFDVGITINSIKIYKKITVDLSKNNQTKFTNGTVEYASDGTVDLTLKADNCGEGAGWILNGDEGVDLSKYDIKVFYVADKSQEYPCYLRVDSVADEQKDETRLAEQYFNLSKYSDTDSKKLGEWDGKYPYSGIGKAIFFKYNTYGGETLSREDTASIKIRTIVALEKQ